MFCPKCGNEIKDGAKFCAKCGWAVPAATAQAASVEKRCASCGTVLKDGVKFCPKCGGAVSTELPQAEAAEEKTEFNVILKAYDEAKEIRVIKAVRTVTGLGLKEAKDLVEGAPKPLKKGVSKEEAAEIRNRVSAAGGTVEIQFFRLINTL